MADNNIDDELEQIKKQLAEIGINYEEHIRNLKRQGKSDEDAIKETKKLASAIDEVSKRYKKSAVEIDASIKSFKNSINKGEVSADELAEELGILRDQINKTSDQHKKQALLDAKADLEEQNARHQASKIVTDSAFHMAGALTLGAANVFKGATIKALSGADAFEIAGSMMEGGVDIINTANQGGANALKSFGAATAGAGGKVGMLGAAASVTGEVFGALSSVTSELAKAGIGFLLAQTKQVIAGFQTMSAAGAIYSGGMMTMVKTSLGAGMSMEQFSKSVSSNSENLARTGLGVAEASKRMAGAMDGTTKAGIAARKGMFALGMGMEEQVDAFANTMARMAGPLGQLRASDAEVAQATQEYAKNLKMVSTMTGEDAKAKQEKIRQEQDNLWMDGQLASMGVKERESWNAVMLALNDDDRRALIERKKYNGVISKDLAGSEAMVPALAKMRNTAMKMALDGHSTTADTYRMQVLFAKDTQKEVLARSNDVGIATSDAAVSIGASMHRSLKSAALTSEGAEKLAAAAIKRQQDAGKQGTDEGANAMELLQKNMIEMQGLAVGHMDKFQNALKMSYEAAMSAVKGLDSLASSAANNPIKTGILAVLPAILGTIGPLILSKFMGGKLVLGASPANPMHVKGGGFGGPSGGPGGSGGYDKNGRYRDAKGRFAKAPTAMSTFKSASALGKIAGVAGAVIGTAMAAGDIYDTENDKTLTKGQKREKEGGIVGSAALGAGGAWAGATTGAMIGALGGPLGAAVGGLIGGALGYWGGSEGGEKLGKAIMKDESTKAVVVAATGATTQTTAPKPLASQSTTDIALEQNKLINAQTTNAEAVKKAMEKPPVTANSAEQQQIVLLQNILTSLQKNNSISSGILQNSY